MGPQTGLVQWGRRSGCWHSGLKAAHVAGKWFYLLEGSERMAAHHTHTRQTAVGKRKRTQ